MCAFSTIKIIEITYIIKYSSIRYLLVLYSVFILSGMGCCCSKKNIDDSDVELNQTTNVTVTCKCGLYGKDVKTKTNPSNNFLRVEGNGTALGSCPLDCDTAYWEVKIGDNPSDVRVGVKRFNIKKPSNLDGALDDPVSSESDRDAWYLQGVELKTGDVVSIYWDQTDLPMLSFSVNGKDVSSSSVNRIRPTSDIIAAVSVKNGASCEMIFDGNHFLSTPKSGKFKMIICATSLI